MNIFDQNAIRENTRLGALTSTFYCIECKQQTYSHYNIFTKEQILHVDTASLSNVLANKLPAYTNRGLVTMGSAVNGQVGIDQWGNSGQYTWRPVHFTPSTTDVISI